MNRIALAVVLGVGIVVGVIFGVYPQLDLKLAALFYDPATHSFIAVGDWVIYVRDAATLLITLLVAPAFFAITGGSWGLQIGVEGVDVVMVFQGDRGMQRLEDAKFQLGADASVAAGPVGRHATADTDWKLNVEVLTYSRAKGLFAGLTLSGADVRRDDSSMDAFYGPDVSSHRVLRGEVATPASANPFIDAVRDARAQAIASK